MSTLNQRPSAFLAPGTGFVEDEFSTDGHGGGAVCDLGGNASNGERQMKLRSLH